MKFSGVVLLRRAMLRSACSTSSAPTRMPLLAASCNWTRSMIRRSSTCRFSIASVGALIFSSANCFFVSARRMESSVSVITSSLTTAAMRSTSSTGTAAPSGAAATSSRSAAAGRRWRSEREAAAWTGMISGMLRDGRFRGADRIARSAGPAENVASGRGSVTGRARARREREQALRERALRHGAALAQAGQLELEHGGVDLVVGGAYVSPGRDQAQRPAAGVVFQAGVGLHVAVVALGIDRARPQRPAAAHGPLGGDVRLPQLAADVALAEIQDLVPLRVVLQIYIAFLGLVRAPAPLHARARVPVAHQPGGR